MILVTGSLGEAERPRVEQIAQMCRLARPDERVTVDDIRGRGSTLPAHAIEILQEVDFLVFDIGRGSSSMLYLLGMAQAMRRPTLVFADASAEIPFAVSSQRLLLYHQDMSDRDFVETFSPIVADALHDPYRYSTARDTHPPAPRRVFISYSHVDAEYLTRLRVHLRPLERENLIDLWVDTKISAGDLWQEKIGVALSEAQAALLLVSADFLAPDFIVSRELPQLLQNAEGHGVRVLPLIVRPCRFLRDQDLSRFQSINDPARPLSALREDEREAVYDHVGQVVEGLLGGGF